MTEYRRDPETGAVYAFGGVMINDFMDTSAEGFQRMLVRRAPETEPHRRLTNSEIVAIERSLGWEDPLVAEDRRMLDIRSDTRRELDERAVARIVASRASELRGLGLRLPSAPRRATEQAISRPGWLEALRDFVFIGYGGRRERYHAGTSYVRPGTDVAFAHPEAFAPS